MSKKLLITIIILVVGFVWWGCENTNPLESDNLTVNKAYNEPDVFKINASHVITSEAVLGDLIAGKNEVVGGVYISHRATDGMYPAENLKIVLGISDGTDYYLTESHVMVTTDVDGGGNPIWPDGTVNKAGNPRPNEFPYYSEMPATTPGYNYFHHWPYTGYGPGNDAHVYHIPWGSGWDALTDIYIAVHAKVAKEVPVYGDVIVTDCWEEVWQIGDEEVIHETEGWLTNFADEFNWFGATPTSGDFGFRGLPTNPFIVGSTPLNEFPWLWKWNELYIVNYDIQWDGELPFGGRLTVSWSPGGSGIENWSMNLNSSSLGTVSLLGVETAGGFLDLYPRAEEVFGVDPLDFGTHTFNFVATSGNGAFWDWVLLEKPCTEIGIIGYETVYESVWAFGDFFEGKNWSMNFGWYWDGSYGINGHNNGIFFARD